MFTNVDTGNAFVQSKLRNLRYYTESPQLKKSNRVRIKLMT